MPFTPTVKPGDDIRWTGQITQDGVTDFTGYTLSSQIRSRSEVNGAMTDLRADATVNWLDEAAGLFEYVIDRTVTAAWPTNATLYLDIRIIDAAGKWLRTETIDFKTAPGVTQ